MDRPTDIATESLNFPPHTFLNAVETREVPSMPGTASTYLTPKEFWPYEIKKVAEQPFVYTPPSTLEPPSIVTPILKVKRPYYILSIFVEFNTYDRLFLVIISKVNISPHQALRILADFTPETDNYNAPERDIQIFLCYDYVFDPELSKPAKLRLSFNNPFLNVELKTLTATELRNVKVSIFRTIFLAIWCDLCDLHPGDYAVELYVKKFWEWFKILYVPCGKATPTRAGYLRWAIDNFSMKLNKFNEYDLGYIEEHDDLPDVVTNIYSELFFEQPKYGKKRDEIIKIVTTVIMKSGETECFYLSPKHPDDKKKIKIDK